eukprot:gene1561-1980_t
MVKIKNSIRSILIFFIIILQHQQNYLVLAENHKLHELPLVIQSRGPIQINSIHQDVVQIKNPKTSRNILQADTNAKISGDLFQVNTKINIGDQEFTVQVDTGSSLMAIPKIGCNNCDGDRPVYDPRKSTNSTVLKCDANTCLGSGSSSPSCKIKGGDCDFQILYGDGSRVSGNIFKDVVTLSGLSSLSHFGANSIETGDFEYPRADGIIGFGRSCQKCIPTVFESMVESNGIKNVFAMLLDYEGGGTLSLGELNHDCYNGNIVYTPMGKGPFYSIKPTSFKIQEHSMNPVLMGNTVIIDSGSTALSLASGAYDSLVHHFKTKYCDVQGICGHPNLIDGQICYTSDSLLSKLPVLYFTFDGGVTISVPPKNYIIKAVLNNGKYGYCWMIDRNDPYTTILGDVFMRGYYTVFDNDQSRIGFAVGKNVEGTSVGLDSNTNNSTIIESSSSRKRIPSIYTFISICCFILLIL